MLQHLAGRSGMGDLYINLATRHLNQHEWGRAYLALEQGMSKGLLHDLPETRQLLDDVCQRLGIDQGVLGHVDQ